MKLVTGPIKLHMRTESYKKEEDKKLLLMGILSFNTTHLILTLARNLDHQCFTKEQLDLDCDTEGNFIEQDKNVY